VHTQLLLPYPTFNADPASRLLARFLSVFFMFDAIRADFLIRLCLASVPLLRDPEFGNSAQPTIEGRVDRDLAIASPGDGEGAHCETHVCCRLSRHGLVELAARKFKLNGRNLCPAAERIDSR
jgi:hypothetical protein